MNNWGIRKKILMLALFPMLLIAIILSSYFTYTQIQSVTDSTDRNGNIIARQIAISAEYAVFSGNIDSLTPSLTKTLTNPDIVSIRITNNQHETLTIFHDKNDEPEKNISFFSLWDERLLTFSEPILTQYVNIDPLEKDENISSSALGYVELKITSRYNDAKKMDILWRSAAITFIILFLNIFLALFVSKQITRPVHKLTNTVKNIASGDYHVRINELSPSELGTLESCVNKMATELQSSRGDFEQRIEEYTHELQQTMEELEIRNVELDIARFNAMKASKAKSEFLANMSHEIRTPLSGILGFSELLIKTELYQQQYDYVDTLRKSASNLLTIIDDVLDLSKIESGKLDINSSKTDILGIVEDVIDLLTPSAYDRDIELFYYFNPRTPRILNIDLVRVRQVLTNLVGNAIKFTEDGYVYLKIEPVTTTDKANYIKFTVTDTGIGMDENHASLLFEAFTQADTSISRRFGGTGLGLVISKKLTQLMGGEIGFESTDGKGSTFWFTLPADIADEKLISPPEQLQECRITLIDNHILSRESFKQTLESWGCTVQDYNSRQYLEHIHNTQTTDVNILIINRNDMRISNFDEMISRLIESITPSLAIASTQSHTELNKIQAQGIDTVIFRSSSHRDIHQNLLNIINGEITTSKNILTRQNETNQYDWTEINIMVIDDNDINLKLAATLLSNYGANVTTATSGAQGIAYSIHTKFDIIFMDLQMPELDGYETSRRIRNIHNNNATPVIIALTADAMSNEHSKALECGMQDIIVKPINEAIIQRVIDTWKELSIEPEIESSNDESSSVTKNFSKTEAIELAAGSISLANELTTMLLNELTNYRSSLEELLSNNNIVDLKQLVHKLHGASRCCGTPLLREAAIRLEEAIDKNDAAQYSKLTQSLLHAIEQLLNTDTTDLMIENKNI